MAPASDRLNRLADADSEDAGRIQPQDPDALRACRERLAHRVSLARRCAGPHEPADDAPDAS